MDGQEEEPPFWRRKGLTEMTEGEWESLCDRCGKCCLIKLQVEETDEILFTDVACYLLNLDTCSCRRYQDRSKLVPDCVKVTPDNIAALAFMPSTCAYRLLAEGQDLPEWHPLRTGRKRSVEQAGMSIRYKVISEEEVDEDDLPDHIVDWPK